MRPFDNINTVFDIIQYTEQQYATVNAFGWRKVLGVGEREEEVRENRYVRELNKIKKHNYWSGILGHYEFLTFIQVKEAVTDIAYGMIDLGISTSDSVSIYARTRYISCVLAFCSRRLTSGISARAGN